MASGTFADFLNALHEFESGVSDAGIEQDRDAIAERMSELQLNLDRIEDGLAEHGKSLDDVLGHSITVAELDGSTSQVQLSLTGILAAAHLHGAEGTCDFLLNGTITADETGIPIMHHLEQFGGFDAPSLTDLRAGHVAVLETGRALVIADQHGGTGDGDLHPVEASNDNDLGGILFPEDAPGSAANIFLRLHDPAVASDFSVSGVEGIDGSVYGDAGTDVIFSFGDDSSIALTGDNFQDLGAGDDHSWGAQGHDTLIGAAGDDMLQDGGSLAGGAGDPVRSFQVGLDILDFTDFSENIALALHEEDGATIIEVDDAGIALDGVAGGDLSPEDFLGVALPDNVDDILSN